MEGVCENCGHDEDEHYYDKTDDFNYCLGSDDVDVPCDCDNYLEYEDEDDEG